MVAEKNYDCSAHRLNRSLCDIPRTFGPLLVPSAMPNMCGVSDVGKAL